MSPNLFVRIPLTLVTEAVAHYHQSKQCLLSFVHLHFGIKEV